MGSYRRPSGRYALLLLGTNALSSDSCEVENPNADTTLAYTI